VTLQEIKNNLQILYQLQRINPITKQLILQFIVQWNGGKFEETSQRVWATVQLDTWRVAPKLYEDILEQVALHLKYVKKIKEII